MCDHACFNGRAIRPIVRGVLCHTCRTLRSLLHAYAPYHMRSGAYFARPFQRRIEAEPVSACPVIVFASAFLYHAQMSRQTRQFSSQPLGQCVLGATRYPTSRDAVIAGVRPNDIAFLSKPSNRLTSVPSLLMAQVTLCYLVAKALPGRWL